MAAYRRRGFPWFVNLLFLFIIIAVARRWSSPDSGAPQPSEQERPREEIASIARSLTPDTVSPSRDGIAAVVLMDVSGSMGESIRDGGRRRPKIDIAREAAIALIRQFDAYGKAHPGETVQVGLMEFSDRPPASAREVIPLSAADPERAESALARMHPDGGTPIGDAMVAGKRALDLSGLTRRHLLVVTDGVNTDGVKPDDVLKALTQRPEVERPSVYFVAFDVDASRFSTLRDAGSLVLPAADAKELNSTLESLLTGKILVEGP